MPQIGGTCLTFDGNGQPAHWSRDELTVMCVRSAQWGALRFTSLTSIMFHYPSQRNDGCNLLGPNPADPIKIFLAVIRCPVTGNLSARR